jgi:hypothetical protein
MRQRRRDAAAAFRTIATVLLATVIAALVVNGAAGVVLYLVAPMSPGIAAIDDAAALEQLYPEMTSDERAQLLEESGARRLEYEPFTEFRERPFAGRYVNVSDEGFRRSRSQGPWPPRPDVLNVFFFGGSTTFGYGVSDDDTIPSHFQDYLSTRLGRPVHVYNFGRGFYYSTQERILFQQLLMEQHIPHVAVFIDGLNDLWYPDNGAAFSSELRGLVDGEDEALVRRWLAARLGRRGGGSAS